NNLIIKNDFVTFLQNNNFKVYDSETNFVLVEVPMKGNDAALHLLKQGFIVRSGELLGYNNAIRITIGLKEDMENLKAIMLELKQESNSIKCIGLTKCSTDTDLIILAAPISQKISILKELDNISFNNDVVITDVSSEK